MEWWEIILFCLIISPFALGLIGALWTVLVDMIEAPDKKLRTQVIEEQEKLDQKVRIAEKRTAELTEFEKETIAKLELAELNCKKTFADVEKLMEEKCKAYPYLGGLIADLKTIHYSRSAQILERKKRPAIKEAARIKELAKETKEIIKEKKILEYKLSYIETLFPNISDIFEPDFNMTDDFSLETDDETDRVRTFLSHDEYIKLPTVEKNQLALDRYLQNRKSKWQIGRDYEMYIGQGFENNGFDVQYTGIIEKLEDMGRDIIAKKGNKTYIVQCKNWAQDKTIHEKHIFQLYGTVVLRKLEASPGERIIGIFVTTTKLSDKARQISKHLNIWVYQKTPLKDFPRIKCNINRATGEKIYHLPFDQQYDKTIIEQGHDEFYAMTVKDAEDAGYRRALKHLVQNSK